ncbi:MAG: MerR family transcriptional regulator [Pseudomonadales bacterium]
MSATIKMKELEERTGFNREAIRFYIREGILPEPVKPKRNVAFYSDSHIKRLLAIKYMQQERDMSLARIKALLSSGEFDSIANPSSLQGLEQLLPALVDGTGPAEDNPLNKIVEETCLSEDEIVELANAGVISISDDNRLAFRDVIILKKWSDARIAGYTPARGYDIEYLKLYQQAVEQLAKYEIELFFNAFSEQLDSDEAASAAANGIEMANDILRQMHTKSLLKAIQDTLS